MTKSLTNAQFVDQIMQITETVRSFIQYVFFIFLIQRYGINVYYIYDSCRGEHRHEAASQYVRYSPQSNLDKASHVIAT